MVTSLITLYIILVCLLLLCLWKIISMRQAAEDLRREFAERLREDTNVGIDISCSDKKIRALAADIDRQLKLLRKEHIRFIRGDREVKEAITNISHDLRTPLTAICGYMDLLSQEDLPELSLKYLRIIENRIQTMKDLTEELFRYSIILSDNPYNIRENVCLNSALEECIAAYYGAFKASGIEPDIQLPLAPVCRKLNPQALSRILSNILSNAIKYSSGVFFLSLSPDGTIRFKNPSDTLDKIQTAHLFDRFYTVDNRKNATGLGLAIARMLTEDMDGKIEADYENNTLIITLWFPSED